MAACLILAAVCLVGCEDAMPGMSVDSEGVTLHNDMPQGAHLTPTFRLGREDESSGIAFGRVVGLAVRGDEILVLDRQATTVYRFDENGALLGRFGERGEGPSEFSDPVGLDTEESTVWVLDSGNGRLVGLSDGEEPITMRLPLRLPYWWRGHASNGVLSTDNVVLRGLARPAEPGVFTDDDDVGVVRWSFESDRLDTLRFSAGSARGVYLGAAGARFPFQPTRLLASTPDGGVWTAISSEYLLTKVNATGDTVVQIRVNAASIPVAPDARADSLRMIEDLMSRTTRVEIDWDAEIPSEAPPLVELVSDGDGNAWVFRRAESGLRIDSFSSEGEWLHSFSSDIHFSGPSRPVVGDGWILGVEEDSLGVDHVVGLRIGG